MNTTNKDIIELVNTGAYTEKEAYEFSIRELQILNAHDQADELRAEACNLGILPRYGIAMQRNMYQPDIQGAGHATWIQEAEYEYWEEPMLFNSATAAQAYINEELIGDEPYYCAHNEAGRPDYWVVDEDSIRTVISCHEDTGNYSWPDECSDWKCGDGKGSVCGCCRQCTEWMAGQDEKILRNAPKRSRSFENEEGRS